MILTKIFILGVGSIVAGLLSTALAFGSLYAGGGMATVSIVDHAGGSRYVIPVPTALIGMAAGAGERAMRPTLVSLEEAHATDYDVVKAALGEMLSEVEDLPNGVLVDVRDGRDVVRVTKSGRSLVVGVTDEEHSVTVRVPARAVASQLGPLLR